MAAQVLVVLGADLNRVRQQVVQLLHGRIVEDGPARVPGWQSAAAPGARCVLARTDSVDRRLAAIERWVGMRPNLDDLEQEIAQLRQEKESAIDTQDFETAAALRDQEKQLLVARAAREKEWTGAAAGRMTLAQELGRVNAELERLRAILREHGIEPGDDAA